jgi:hypothetical protein
MEYGLSSADLSAWHIFNDAQDSGPNNHDISYVSGSSLFASGRGAFNGHYIALAGVNADSISVIFDFQKINQTSPCLILSNNNNSGFGFFLGCTQNGDFFLYVNSSQGKIIRFFESVRTANRAILIFSRSGNYFSLSSYSPLTNSFESQTITIQEAVTLPSSDIKFGNNTAYSPPEFPNAAFNIYEMAVVSNGFPSFILLDLCKEIYTSASSPRNDFLFKFVSVKEKSDSLGLNVITNNTGADTSILLPYVEAVSGFSYFPETGLQAARFYRNGIREVPTIFDSYVRFPAQSSLDMVTFDNFDLSVSVSGVGSTFSGHTNGLFPRDKAVLLISPSSRRYSGNFVTLDSGNLCYSKNIVFPKKSNLITI